MAFSVSIYEEPFIPRVVNFKTLAKCYILPRAHEIAKIAQEKLGNLWFIEGSNYDVSLAEQLQAQGLEKLGRSTVYRLCDGWLVKIGQSLSFEDSSHDPGPSGGEKVMLGGPHKFNHVFRPLFNEWIGQVMRRQAIQISLPQEFLYPIKTEGKVHSYQ